MARITKRETLLECLELMKKFRNAFAQDKLGMLPNARYMALYEEYDIKCEILREMIQALESEPVRRAMADWQREIMKNGPEALKPEEIFTKDAIPFPEDENNEEVLQLREGI